MNAPLSRDPLLQPYRLRHLTLKNRLMSTSHEPAYSEDGLPKERYRLYHAEKAKGGIALTMTAGSAIVSRDSPAAFGNLHAYRDEIVPWLRELADQCHEHDCKVMIQITHLGRRTGWNKADWLPVLAPSPLREPAHRAFPKTMEDWDIERIIADYASAAQRMQAAGLDGIEFESYGHLMDGFWSPLTNRRDDEYNGSLDNRLRFTWRVIDAVRAAVGPDFVVGIRMVADEDAANGLTKAEGIEIAQRLASSGKFDFLNIIRGTIETDAALTKVIPITGMRSSPSLDFAGDVREATKFPVFHAARIGDVATARHAIAAGKLDMVGMTRPHIADGQHEPVEEAAAVAGGTHEELVHRRRQPGDAQPFHHVVGCGRRAVDAHPPPDLGLARRAGRAGADLPALAGAAQRRMDRKARAGRLVGHVGIGGTPQSAARREQRNRLQQIGLAGAVLAGQHDEPGVEVDRERRIIAEARQLQPFDEDRIGASRRLAAGPIRDAVLRHASASGRRAPDCRWRPGSASASRHRPA